MDINSINRQHDYGQSLKKSSPNFIFGLRKLRRKERRLKHSFGRLKRVFSGKKFY